jgi:hypothetical protein
MGEFSRFWGVVLIPGLHVFGPDRAKCLRFGLILLWFREWRVADEHVDVMHDPILNLCELFSYV